MNEVPYGAPLPDDVLDQDTIRDIRRRLNFELPDWLRNTQRALSGVVQEQTQGTSVDLDHIRGDTAAALRAVENAIGELEIVAATLRPYTVVREDAAA